MSIITLTTDFGTKDHYVGAMKGVILGIAPRASLIDITHEIDSHNITQAAFVIRHTIDWYPPGTVHVIVVDPGVGTCRRIIAGRFDEQVVIGPDNGIMTMIDNAFDLKELVSVENANYFGGLLSNTFHGRDIMAPVAAHVTQGVPLNDLGPPAGQIEMLKLPAPTSVDPFGICGCILYIDHFGNLVTNIHADQVAEIHCVRGDLVVELDGRVVGPVRTTYGDVPTGEPLALIGSSQMLEIAINQGRASDVLNATADTPVSVRPPSPVA